MPQKQALRSAGALHAGKQTYLTLLKDPKLSSRSGSFTDPLKESRRSSCLVETMSLWLFAFMKDFDVCILLGSV